MIAFSRRFGRYVRVVVVAMAAHGLASAQDLRSVENGMIGESLSMAGDAALQAAAESARRDSDPRLNGSLLAEQALLPSLDEAWGDYERCHWREAFLSFAILADAGHPEAARMAAAMARHGTLLYQQKFEVAAQRLDSWRRVSQVRAAAAVASK